jgi:hypothetical protein
MEAENSLIYYFLSHTVVFHSNFVFLFFVIFFSFYIIIIIIIIIIILFCFVLFCFCFLETSEGYDEGWSLGGNGGELGRRPSREGKTHLQFREDQEAKNVKPRITHEWPIVRPTEGGSRHCAEEPTTVRFPSTIHT